jgi:DNA repair photolyase
MTTKNFNGKAIYNPSGKAGEYSYWAANLHVGCSNGCTYCYCKKGILAGAMGQDKPQLKKCFKDEKHARAIFLKEFTENLDELKKHGLFYSFTTDPMLKETIDLTLGTAMQCVINDVPVKILTKCTEWVDSFLMDWYYNEFRPNFNPGMFAFGFTLTGHDELEPNASTNAERIEAMKKLHDAGFKTFASIEPIIDIKSSQNMILLSSPFCDLFKIGVKSGKKYDRKELKIFISETNYLVSEKKIYFKDSLLKAAGISRDSLPKNCVTRDFNIFKS